MSRGARLGKRNTGSGAVGPAADFESQLRSPLALSSPTAARPHANLDENPDKDAENSSNDASQDYQFHQFRYRSRTRNTEGLVPVPFLWRASP